MLSKTDFSEHISKDSDDLDFKEIFTVFLERMPGGIFRYKDDGEELVDFANKGLFDMLGCASREEFDELTDGCFMGIVHPADREQVRAEIEGQAHEGAKDVVVYRLNHRDGKLVWVTHTGHKVIDGMGIPWFYVTLVDATDNVNYEKKLLEAQERIDILTALSNDVVFDIECGTGRAQVFGAFEERFGRPPVQSDFVVTKRCGKECDLDIEVHSLEHMMDNITENSLVDFETSTEGPDGAPVWYRYQSVVFYNENGDAVRHIGRLLDTNDMIMRETQFRRKAERDDLTGLYNRSAAMDRINSLLGSDSATAYTFFLIDVDDFKTINDTYGHPVGDEVLKGLAEFLCNVMRKDDIVARFGGDEFALFANGLGEGPALDRVLGRLLRGPFARDREADATQWEDGEGPNPSITIGAITTAKRGVSFEELYAGADEALYEAKRIGKARYELKIVR